MIFKNGDTQNWTLINHSRINTKDGSGEVWRLNITAPLELSEEMELTFLDKDKGNVMYATLGGKYFQGKYVRLKE